MTEGKITLVLTTAEFEAIRELLNAYAGFYVPDPSDVLNELHDYINDL